MKRFAISTTTILALSTLTLVSHAENRPNLPNDCKSATTQMEINFCAKKQAETADQQLNSTYQILQSRLTKDLRTGSNSQIKNAKQRYQKLINAQIAWIKFRDTSCEYERSGVEGGSIAPTIYYSCVAKVTDRRTADLQEYIKE